MDSRQDAHSSRQNSVTSEQERKKSNNTRGPTYMISFQRKIDSGHQPPPLIHFDIYGRATGTEEDVDSFKSFLGMLAKTRVEITLESWKDYPEPRRELMWQHILKEFNVENPSELARETTLQDISDKARNFRAELVRKYLNPKGKKYGKFPGDDYKEITLRMWDEFIAKRQTEEFQALSAKNKENASKNKNPHRAGRGGYRKVKKKIQKEKLSQMPIELNNSGCAVNPPSPARHEVWMRARQDEKGSYLSEETAKIATTITQYADEYARGEFLVDGRVDILTSALPNKERPGRVRGEEGNIGWKKYLAHTKRPDNTVSKKTIEELNTKIKHMEQEREIERQQNKLEIDRFRDEMRAELKARDELLEKLMGKMNESPNLDDQHEKTMMVDSFQIPRQSSTITTIQFENISPLGLRCRLYLDHPTRRLVAHGNVYGQGVLLHGKPLNGSQARVSVKGIISGEENSVVPYVTDEVKTLGSSIDNYIAWPRTLIEVDESSEEHLPQKKKIKSTQFNCVAQMVASEPTGIRSKRCRIQRGKIDKKKTNQDHPSQEGKQLTKASKLMEESTKLVCDKYEPSTWDEFMKTTYHIIFGTETRKEVIVHISSDMMRQEFYFSMSMDVLKDFMKMKFVDVSILRYWIWVLYGRFELQGKKTYRFLDPGKISCKEQSGKDLIEFNNNRIHYVENALKDDSIECWLMPYNAGLHWMLCAILPKQATIFWLDSLRDSGRRQFPIKHIINLAFFNLKYQGKSHYIKPGKFEPKWIDVKCPIQDGEFEGGYFVMRMMYDIMVRPTSQCIDEIYGNEASPFLKKQIDEIRSLFCAHFNSKYDEQSSYSREHIDSLFRTMEDNSK